VARHVMFQKAEGTTLTIDYRPMNRDFAHGRLGGPPSVQPSPSVPERMVHIDARPPTTHTHDAPHGGTHHYRRRGEGGMTEGKGREGETPRTSPSFFPLSFFLVGGWVGCSMLWFWLVGGLRRLGPATSIRVASLPLFLFPFFFFLSTTPPLLVAFVDCLEAIKQ
jgi:hypothetical protein